VFLVGPRPDVPELLSGFCTPTPCDTVSLDVLAAHSVFLRSAWFADSWSQVEDLLLGLAPSVAVCRVDVTVTLPAASSRTGLLPTPCPRAGLVTSRPASHLLSAPAHGNT
jgi:hypothetical protein